MGFQAINGKSYISFPENSRSHNMMLFVAELRMRNLANNEIIPYINCAINDYSVKRENMIRKFNIEKMEDSLLSDKLKYFGKTKGYKKTFTNAMNKFIYKEDKKDEFTIDALIRFELLDNYKPHHNKQFKKFCELLKIKLIYLPAYTPQYNPIEQVWKSIKRIIYDPTISNREELISIFKEEYYKIIYNESFYKKWVEKFL